MKTKILAPSEVSIAVEVLKKREGLVAFPTETVYGLGAPLFDESSVRRVFLVKGRPFDNPLIAHVDSMEMAMSLIEKKDPYFEMLAKKYWPGPLTFVLPRPETIPAIVSAGQPTIAIRMPAHPVARALIQALKEPLVAPSANLSGKPSPTSIQDVLEDLDGKIECVLDGGECQVGIESTVLSLVSSIPTILRPGTISKKQLEETLGMRIGLAGRGDPVYSPGMKYRHYAPKARIRLVFEKEKLVGPYLEPSTRNLYKQLREADRAQMEEVQIYCSLEVQKEEGPMNRLLRAAGKIG